MGSVSHFKKRVDDIKHVALRAPRCLIERVDAARGEGESRNAALCRLVEAGLGLPEPAYEAMERYVKGLSTNQMILVKRGMFDAIDLDRIANALEGPGEIMEVDDLDAIRVTEHPADEWDPTRVPRETRTLGRDITVSIPGVISGRELLERKQGEGA